MKKKGSIAFKFLFILFSVFFITMLIFSALFYVIEKISIEKKFNETAEAAADRLAFNLIEPLWVNDADAVQKLINYEKTDKSIICIIIKDDSDEVIFSVKRDGKGEFAVFDIKGKFSFYKDMSKDILKNEEKLGSIRIFFTDSVNKKVLFSSFIKIVIMFSMFFSAIIIFLYIAFNELILKKLRVIFSYIQDMSKGELKKININSNDEIGVLSGNLNIFSNNMIEITDHIKNMIKLNFGNSSKINEDAKNISDTTNDICGSMEKIQSQSELLNDEIDKSRVEIINGNSAISLIDEQIKNQKKAIVETSSIVQSIIKTLEDLSSLASKNRDFTSNLSETGMRGSSDMKETIKSIESITGLTDVIKEMIAVINGISLKIRLLSLNAAIEAAHAGDSGLGFAIVADEIRNLSDDTKSSIDGISKSFISVIAKINEAKDITLKTEASMESIIKGINEESSNLETMIKVYDELIKQNNDMKKVFIKLEDDINGTEKLSAEMYENSGNIQKSVVEIQNLSDISLKSVIGINAGLMQISKMLNNITAQSIENTDMVGEIEKEMNYFKRK